tara:strand:- start:355 stop:804 length:450 start_codon:yes stop_codon:yes gene_type:complete
MRKIWDSSHQCYSVKNWKKYGLVCRESETYKDIYYHVMSVNNCELCNVTFSDDYKHQRSMDHDHETGYFRKVLCRACNANYKLSKPKTKKHTTSGFSWITNHKIKRKSKYYFYWRFERKEGELGKRKSVKTLAHALALSFIYILKKNPY